MTLLKCYEEFPRSGGKRARATWWRFREISGWERLTRKPSEASITRAKNSGELYEVPGSGDCSTLPASLAKMQQIINFSA